MSFETSRKLLKNYNKVSSFNTDKTAFILIVAGKFPIFHVFIAISVVC